MQDVSANVAIQQINGSLNRGGWECRFISLLDTDLFGRWQEVLVKWRAALGGPPGAQRLAFKGHVLPQSFQFDKTGSTAISIAQTSDGFLRRGWLQGIGFADTDADPRDHYHQFDSVTGGGERMTLGRIVRHILGYYDSLGAPPATNPDWVAHTNMVYHATENPHGWLHLDNVELGNSARADYYIVRETNNLWNRLREIARNEFYEIVFDKSNVLWYQPHPMYLAALPPPVMTFDKDFCLTPPIVETRDVDTLRQVKLHAVTDAGDTLHSSYPASPTHTYGNVLEVSRLRCNSQAALDAWAQRKYLFENRAHTVRWTAPGLCGLLFEILDRVQLTYTGTAANGVHINWIGKKFWIHDINVLPAVGFSGQTAFILEEENIL